VDPRRRLSDNLSELDVAWAATALAAMRDDAVVYAGNSRSPASSTVGDLLRLYQIRLQRSRERPMDVHGIVELVACLTGRDFEAVIYVEPFLGPAVSVSAFWDSGWVLVGCITILGRDPEASKINLNAAIGN
jgi:hypothetical protein